MLRLSLIAVALVAACTGSGVQVHPDAGRIRFGRSLDTTTFELTGDSTAFEVGDEIAYRAALSRLVTPGTSLRLVGTLDGTVIFDQTQVIEEQGEMFAIYGGRIPGVLLSQPGSFNMRVFDVDNNELAEGGFELTP